MSIVSVYIPSPYNVFVNFLEEQVHKDRNYDKMSDACANSFGRYIVIAQCMRNVFTFF